MFGAVSSPRISVVIATYNREQSLGRLLAQLNQQTLPYDTFEVLVVDDGSPTPVETPVALDALYALTVLRQDNAGPAAARHRAIQCARGEIIVIIDDDMRVREDYLERHLQMHPAGTRRAVLGRIFSEPDTELRLFERFQIAVFDKLAADIAANKVGLVGSNLYTGNVSFRRDDYLRVGGFDSTLRLSEDAELGIRLEQSGVEFVFSDVAAAWHASDHTSLQKWMSRSFEYGRADARISQKHPDVYSANPWRFLFDINPLSRLLVLGSAMASAPMRMVSRLAMRISLGLSRVGAERLAIAGTTLVYGLQYYAGVRANTGSRRSVVRSLAKYLNTTDESRLPASGKCAKLFADIHADREAMHVAERKYGSSPREAGFWSDYIQKVGFQMMVAYRLMHFYDSLGLHFFAKVTSRSIRHMYAADIHWEARLAPGVIIVHGVGLVLSHAARVGPDCVLFHNVTLGESIHPQTRVVGAPVLERGVHVGAGATLLGPITVGSKSKIAAGCVLMTSVPPLSVVEMPSPTIRVRSRIQDTPEPSLADALSFPPKQKVQA